MGGSHVLSGAFASTFTFTGITGVTFPTSGTLATTAQIPTGAALTKTDDTNVTLTLGGSPTTALVNAASLTLGWTGQLGISRGGTNVSSVTIAPTATSFAGWDANLNLSANNHIQGYATTATAAAITTLTVASPYQQFFTGSTTQTVKLPVTSTLVLGQSFMVVNNSSGVVTVQSSGANTITAMAATTVALFTCILTSGTTAASWSSDYNSAVAGVTSVTGTANRITSTGGSTPVIDIDAAYVGQASITTLGTIATGTWSATNIALNKGGTNAALTASNGGIFYSTASAGAILAGTATANQLLMSGASTTPLWSTSTYPTTNAINTLLYASSANVMAALATANSSVLVTSGGGVPSLSTTLPSGLTATNLTLTTPALGTPSAGVLTNTTGGGGLRSFQVFTTGTAATYTKPANVTSVLIEVIGGGGGSGGVATTGATTSGASGGGGGGGYSMLYVASAASTYTYSVGAGGLAGTAGNNAGGTGGTTSVNVSSLQATGGGGGTGAAAVASTIGGAVLGGTVGVGTGGTVNLAGMPGGVGLTVLLTGVSGYGGNSVLGTGGRAVTNGNVGGVGTTYGGGASGSAFTNAAAQTGAAGAAGLIVFWEFS
jgi:hypothetical protein